MSEAEEREIEEKMQQNNDAKDLILDIQRNGDLLIVANKGEGKTNALMVLARQFRDLGNTRVIIFETFPKWCHEFDTIPYLLINDKDEIETKKTIDLEDIWLRHERDFSILRGKEIKEALKTKTDLIFLMDIKDTERISFFIHSVIQHYYRKHYLTAYKYGLKAIKENVVFICEESQNLFDRTIISRKLFNRLRKMFSETRNLKLHFILATQRIVDISTRIRGRTRLLIGRVNLDDYDLKIRKLLRHTKFNKGQVLTLKLGEYIYPSLNRIIKFPLFKQLGKPYLWKPRPKAPQPKPTLIERLSKPSLIERLFGKRKKPKIYYHVKPTKRRKKTEEEDKEENLGEEHTLLAESEEEESESLFW